MRGCRPLTDAEVTLVSQYFEARSQTRNRAFFVLGVRTGYRLAELLALRLVDVAPSGTVGAYVTVPKSKVKGRRHGRTVPLHEEARLALAAWIAEASIINPKARIFNLSSVSAWRFLKIAFRDCRLEGRVATHSMRKTFALRLYSRLGQDLLAVASALDHASPVITARYLAPDDARIAEAILAD